VDAEAAIYGRLSGTPEVTALAGNRIYPNEADADEPRPLVVYSVTGWVALARDLATHAVLMSESEGLIIVAADDKPTAKALAGRIVAAVNGKQFAGVQRAYITDQSSEESEDGSDIAFAEVLTFKVIQ
jgi:hypothetical protein